MDSEAAYWESILPTKYGSTPPSRRGIDGPTPSRLPRRMSSVLGSFVQVFSPSSREPFWSLVGSFPVFKTLNYVFYVLGTPHINFNKNEHVKLTQTFQDTQVLSKAYLPNVMDVIGHLTSKINQTIHTA